MIEAMIWLGSAFAFGADRSSLRRAESAWLYDSRADDTMVVLLVPPLIMAAAKALMADERASLFPLDARTGRTSTQAPQTRGGGTPPAPLESWLESGTKLRTTNVMRWSSGLVNGRNTANDAPPSMLGPSFRPSCSGWPPRAAAADGAGLLSLRCPSALYPCATNVQSDWYPGQWRPRRTH